MIGHDTQSIGSVANSAQGLDAEAPNSRSHLVLCAVFQDLARDWLQLWCVERGEGLNDEESKRFARLQLQLSVIAQIVFETPPSDRRVLEAVLDSVAFFDASQPWIVEGRFDMPFEQSKYTTALTMLASLLVHEIKSDPWSAFASRHPSTLVN